MKNITNFNLDLLQPFSKIYVLVSGGIDSTYLYELIKEYYPNKTIPVNCWNPYEQSTTLNILQNEPRFIQIKPNKSVNYSEILKNAFLTLPKSFQMKNYHKKVFGCCRIIKHSSFKKDKQFTESNTVVISGIKYSDGRQRRLWLTSLKTGKSTTKGTIIKNAPTFFHKHKWGALYCYPFRDFKSNIPQSVIYGLKQKYPNLTHSGCYLCPVLVRFESKIRKSNEQFDIIRLEKSIEYAKKLGVYKNAK